MMSFSIFIQAPYIDVDAFYPYDGWNDNDVEVDERYEMIEKCIAVCPRDTTEIEKLMDVMLEAEDEYLEGAATGVIGCDARIEIKEHPDGDFRPSSVKRRDIENPFGDYEKYAVPELTELIPEIINSKFCFIKVWENSGGFAYKGDGDFDLSKLDCVKGQFLYDGEEFNFTDGDGSSSYTCFYKDGEEV